MKKPFWLIVLLCSFFSLAYSQDQNQGDNSSDDVYYSGDDEQTAAPATDQQYDDNGNPIDNGAPTYQQFYDELSPYGTWINYPGQGYVWVPNQVPGDFSPYLTGGHWVFTDEGWTWVSDYDWGWGPFHYGRWFEDDVYGWMWVPGYDWAPAWVVWGDYGGYYCWAPCGPGAVIGPHYRPNNRYWHFVPHDHITQHSLSGYALHDKDYAAHGIDIAHFNDKVNIISHANTYHQSVFFSGPKAEEVSKYTGQKINRVAINNTSKPSATKVNNGHLQIYRPNISRTTVHQPAPAHVAKAEDIKHTNHTTIPQQQRTPAAQPRQNVTTPRQAEPVQRQQQTWIPPRQSAPRPVQSQPQSRPMQSAPQERGFIPSAAPRSAPAPQHFSSPAPMRSAPAGGGFHGGGGRR